MGDTGGPGVENAEAGRPDVTGDIRTDAQDQDQDLVNGKENIGFIRDHCRDQDQYHH